MKKALKWIFGSLGVLVLGVAILIGVLLFVVDPNTFKPTIEKIASNYALDVDLKGDLAWQFYPNVALKLNSVDVKNGVTSEEILNVETVALSVKLLPLLKLDIQVDGAYIEKPQIFFTINRNSRSNIQDILDKFKSAPKTDDEAKKNTDATEQTKSGNELKIFITSFEIKDAAIKYANYSIAKNKQTADLKNFNLRASKISLENYFPLKVNGALTAKLPLDVALSFKLDSLVKANLADNNYSLKDMVLDLNVAKPLYTDKALDLNFKGLLGVDLNKSQVNLKLATLIKALQMKDIATKDINLSFDLAGNFKTNQYEIENFVVKTGVKSPTQKTTTETHSLNLSISPIALNLGKNSAKFNEAKLTYAGVKLDLNRFSVNKFSPLSLKTDVDLDIANLRDLLNKLEIKLPKMADEKNTLKFLKLSANINMQNNLVKILKLNSEFDESTLVGALGYGLKNSAISGNLRLNKINADRYLAPSSNKADANKVAENNQAKDAKKSTGDEKVLPIETLKKLNVDFSAFVGDILVKNLKINNLDFAVKAKNGLVKMDKLNAKLYEGSFKSKLVVDASKTPVEISINEDLNNIQLKPILKDLNKKEMLTGAINLKGGYFTKGNSMNEWKGNLSGQGLLTVNKGAFIGTNVPKLICLAGSTLSKKPSSKKDWSKNTEFNKLVADVKIKKGLINNNANISIDGLEVTGKGFYSLPVSDFAYNLGIRLLQDADQASCHINDQMTKIRWPLICQGSLAGEKKDWGCFIDVATLGTDLAKVYLADEIKQAKQVAEKAKQEAKKEVEKAKQQVQKEVEKTQKQVEDKIQKETEKLQEEGKKAIQDAFKGLF